MKRGAPPTPTDPAGTLPPDEREAFYDAVRDVAPLAPTGRREPPAPAVKPIPRQRLRGEREALIASLAEDLPWDVDLQSGEELVFLRPGVGRQTLRRLRRGHWVIQGELDLHGMRVDEARLALAEFLLDCRARGARCVRVIHGKGLGSRNREPVLKQRISGWLGKRDEVLAYCQARAVDGGGGALIVLLAAPKTADR